MRRIIAVESKIKIYHREGTAQYYTEELGNESESVRLDMIVIPGGTFWMGTPDEEIERLCKEYNWNYFRRESPQHQVTVSPFFMGKYPITQAQWKIIAEREDMRVNRDLEPDPSRFKDTPQPPLARGEKAKMRWDRPVERVNWYEAKEYCDRLSKLTGREYRLPSEAEWEYACRGINPPAFGTPLSKGGWGGSKEEWNEKYNQPFHFGETISTKLANYSGNSVYGRGEKGEYRAETTPVGYFEGANGFGLYDLHGNVWEWCEDDYHENYENAPADGSAWSGGGSNTTKILRGGSWYDYPYLCRSAYRNDFSPVNRFIYNGFRVVRDF